jgi:hypothetical protein
MRTHAQVAQCTDMPGLTSLPTTRQLNEQVRPSVLGMHASHTARTVRTVRTALTGPCGPATLPLFGCVPLT